MNSGIQDAVNLGWKLALTAPGVASEALLDTYNEERRPVARAVLTLTHALFRVESADSPVVPRARVALAPPAVSMALRLRRLRTLGFRIIGQQWVRYPRGLAAADGLPKLRRGPGAGIASPTSRCSETKFPADSIKRSPRQGSTYCCAAPHTAGTLGGWPGSRNGTAAWPSCTGSAPTRSPASCPTRAGPRWPVSAPGTAPSTSSDPDGHVGYRCAGFDLAGLERHMTRLLPGPRTARPQ
jgi:hypothetical protein